MIKVRKPRLTKSEAIAEQLAAMLEELLDGPVDSAECSDEIVYTSDGWDDEPDDDLYDPYWWWADEPEVTEPDWSTPHSPNFTDAHCRECEDCAYLWAEQWAPDPDDVVSEVAYGIEPETSWPPVLGYRELLAELGDAFTLTGPKRPEPPSRQYVRVYELARVCDLPPKVVIGLLRFRDEYVTGHLSKLAKPAAREFLADLANIHGDLDALIENSRPKSIQEQFAQAFAYNPKEN